jgi:hypothetical protein
MKRRIGVAVFGLAAAFVASPAHLYAQFEGTADFKITFQGAGTQGLESSGKMYVSRAGYRSEWEMALGSGGARKGDSASGPRKMKMTMVAKKGDPDHLYLVDDESKTYSVTDLKKAREESKTIEDKRTYTVEKLGTDTVAGIPCQKAAVTSSKGDVFDVCVGRSFGIDADVLAAMTRNHRSGSWFTALKDNGIEGFPVRFGIRPRKDADATMIWEITRIDRRAPPASLFDVPPPGYRQTDHAVGGLSPEQRKALDDAKAKMLENMTPEQRKAYEDALRRHGQPTPEATSMQTPTPTPNP